MHLLHILADILLGGVGTVQERGEHRSQGCRECRFVHLGDGIEIGVEETDHHLTVIVGELLGFKALEVGTCLVDVDSVFMVGDVFLERLDGVKLGGGYPVERVNLNHSLLDIPAGGMQLHVTFVGVPAVVHQGIGPVGINLLECLQVNLDGIAMGKRRIDVHVEEVLQHQRLAAEHGVGIGPLLVLPFLVLHEINAQEHDDEGQDEGDDNGRETSTVTSGTTGSRGSLFRFLLGLRLDHCRLSRRERYILGY